MVSKPTRLTPSVERHEVTPTPSPAPCRCGSLLCDTCWQEIVRTQGYGSGTADAVNDLVPWQIHVDLDNATYDALTAVAAKKRVRVGDIAQDVLTAWAGRRMACWKPR